VSVEDAAAAAKDERARRARVAPMLADAFDAFCDQEATADWAVAEGSCRRDIADVGHRSNREAARVLHVGAGELLEGRARFMRSLARFMVHAVPLHACVVRRVLPL